MQKVRPYSDPDWDLWLYVPELSRVDAICLSMNICPQHAQEDYGILDAVRGDDEEGFGPRLPDQEAAAVFRRRMFLSKGFGRRVKLADFVKFAEQVGWEIPTELASIMAPRGTGSAPKVESAAASPVEGDSAQPIATSIETDHAASYPNLENETRTHVGTGCAAYWLNRKEQTLRTWAVYENGPIRPIRISGRLAWPVAEIRKLLKK